VPKGVMVVQSQPVSPEREDEYNAWYSGAHMPDIREVPGFVAARRYRVRATGPIPADPAVPTYLAIYEVEADDFDVPLREMSARSADGRVRRSDSLQTEPRPVVTFYELLD
jgi:hypothetical protein